MIQSSCLLFSSITSVYSLLFIIIISIFFNFPLQDLFTLFYAYPV